MSASGNYFIRCFSRTSWRTSSSTFHLPSFTTSSKMHANCFSHFVNSQDIGGKPIAFLNERNKYTSWNPVCKLHYSVFSLNKSCLYKPFTFTTLASKWDLQHGRQKHGSWSFSKRRGRGTGRTFKKKDGSKRELAPKYTPLVKKERFKKYEVNENFDGVGEDYLNGVELRNLHVSDREPFHKPYKLHKGEIDSIMWEFQADERIKDAAKNEGLNEHQFMKTTNLFRKRMRKQFRKYVGLQSVMCAINSNQAQLHDLFPFFLKHANELYPTRNCDIEIVKRISDLRGPHDLFPKARELKRKIFYHAGPTNSGKTHTALERFRTSKSGVYCSPLRLLAAEVYKRTNNAGVPCDMLTGEERLWAVSAEEPSSHVTCTVEMTSTNIPYECAVIDEIQMMSDPRRGWAWTRALLGLVSEEVHLCGEDTAIDLVQSMADICGDDFKVLRYSRLGPLTVSSRHLGGNLTWVKPGDCVVAFSQKELFTIRQCIEKATPNKCAIVYGGLPPATRVEQASKFNDPENEHKILVASDAIGMGLNLNIKRIVFNSVQKYDGYSMDELTPSHAKQIAGRAGRYGSDHPEGEVTTLHGRDFRTMKKLLNTPSEIVQAAGLAPTLEQIEMLSYQLPDASLSRLLEVFLTVVQLDGDKYFMCDLESVKYLSDLIDGIPLTTREQYTISQAPVNINKNLSSAMVTEFAWYISKQKEVSSKTLQTMICWPPTMPKTLKSLQDTETLHEICDVYLWLSYRFPEIFIDEEEVRHMQKFIENVIGAAVTSNLKQRRVPRPPRQQMDDSPPVSSK